MATCEALGRDPGGWVVIDLATEWSMTCNTILVLTWSDKQLDRPDPINRWQRVALRGLELDQCWESEISNGSKTYSHLEYQTAETKNRFNLLERMETEDSNSTRNKKKNNLIKSFLSDWKLRVRAWSTFSNLHMQEEGVLQRDYFVIDTVQYKNKQHHKVSNSRNWGLPLRWRLLPPI